MTANENVKKRKVNKGKKRKKIFLAVFLIIAAALFCGLSLTVFFPVKSITVSGNSLYSVEEIIAHSGIKDGDNIIRISEKNVLSSLQGHLPFVDNVKVTKNLTGTVKLTVTIASEVYAIKVDEMFYTADDEGRILKSYSEKPEGVLFIDCVASVGEGDIQQVVFEEEKAEMIISAICKRFETLTVSADYIDLTDMYEIKMGFDSRYTVNFGEFTYFEEKISHFLKMLEDPSFSAKSGDVDLSQYTPGNPKAFFVKREEDTKKD